MTQHRINMCINDDGIKNQSHRYTYAPKQPNARKAKGPLSHTPIKAANRILRSE